MTQFEAEENRIREEYFRREHLGKAEIFCWRGSYYQYFEFQKRLAWSWALQLANFNQLETLEVLDVGCGEAGWLRLLLEWGATPRRLHGIDLLEHRIHRARAVTQGEVDLQVGSASDLPFADGTMDLVAASTLFSSIKDPAVRSRIADEMQRVSRDGGWVMVFDFAISNPRNPDTVSMPKKEISRLFSEMTLRDFRSLILVPPLVHLLGPQLTWMAHLMETFLPFLRTHRLFVLQKNSKRH